MEKMKKILTLLLALVMMLSVVALAACGTDGADGATGATGTTGATGETGATGTDGTDGADAATFVDAYINVAGNLVLVLSDGTEIIAGNVATANGTGEGYGICHTSYVGYGTVTYVDGEMTEVTLEEAITPLHLSSYAGDWYDTTTLAAYITSEKYMTTFYVADGSTTYTFTYSTDDSTYLLEDDSTPLLTWLADDANCEIYFSAIEEGGVSVETGDKDQVLTKEELYKSLNGYWSMAAGKDADYWLTYRDATVAYVLENGFTADQFVKDSDGVMTDNNGVVTGATWNDMQDYYDVLVAAGGAKVAEGTDDIYIGQYSYENYGLTYGMKVVVVLDAESKISNILVVSDEVTGWISLSDANSDYGWTDAARQVWLDAEAELVESFIGMTADEVEALSATIAGVVGATDAVTDDFCVTGATQSSARLVLAIQNALCGGASGVVEAEAGDPVTDDGTYTGTATSSYATFNVTVVIDNSKVTSVTIENTSSTNYNYSDKVTDEALKTITDSFAGLTITEVLALTTDASATGDYVITGATVSSNTLLEAVQAALTVQAAD